LKDLIHHFHYLRKKEKRKILGLMSGTSTDGITVALAHISGTGLDTEVELIGHQTYPYDHVVKDRVFNLFNPNQGTVKDVCEMNNILGEAFAEAANRLLSDLDKKDEVDLIGSHGQTIWHQPEGEPVSRYSSRSTLQIAEPAVISEKTGLPVIADFRKADVAMGGQGAPLTPYLDYILHRASDENRVLQNIGGIANLTYLPANTRIEDVVAFDTGPGNMIIDALAMKYTGNNYDVNGIIARQGNTNQKLLEELLSHPFYHIKPPKTTGRECFGLNYAEKVAKRAQVLDISLEDLISTVTSLTVKTIIKAYETILPDDVDVVYLSGGGSKNPVIVDGLREGLSIPLYDYSTLGIASEAKEALLMALLANEYIMGTPSNILAATGARKRVVLGYPTWI
jgi:anhydro-N-acetylmuramic acid kinase